MKFERSEFNLSNSNCVLHSSCLRPDGRTRISALASSVFAKLSSVKKKKKKENTF